MALFQLEILYDSVKYLDPVMWAEFWGLSSCARWGSVSLVHCRGQRYFGTQNLDQMCFVPSLPHLGLAEWQHKTELQLCSSQQHLEFMGYSVASCTLHFIDYFCLKHQLCSAVHPQVTPRANNSTCSFLYTLIWNHIYTMHECESIEAWHSYFRVGIASQYELILLTGLFMCLLCKPYRQWISIYKSLLKCFTVKIMEGSLPCWKAVAHILVQ